MPVLSTHARILFAVGVIKSVPTKMTLDYVPVKCIFTIYTVSS